MDSSQSSPQKFRVKPAEIQAMQWSGQVEGAHPIIQWVNGSDQWTAVWREYQAYSSGGLFPQEAQDHVAEGVYVRREGSWKEQYVGPNHWLALAADGAFFVVKPDVFVATYEQQVSA